MDFSSFFSNDQKRKLLKDTSKFFIGSPEAEAESINSSKIHISKVFNDYLEIIPQLESEKFIVSGRKGSGKTAIAEFLDFMSSKNPNIFCDFVKKSDLDIERIIHLTEKHDLKINQIALIQWVILTKLVKMLVENEALSSVKEIGFLKTFIKKNSGYIDIDSSQIEELIQSKGWEVNVEYFKRFLTWKFGNKYDIKKSQTPFYKLIPHLKDTVKVLFKSIENSNNQYLLIFDDLDIGFNTKNENSCSYILDLIRTVKEYNITFFGKSEIRVKIILLIRDDISRFLISKDADTAKLFTSYEVPIKWYEYNDLQVNENNLKIKKFINKRIEINFIENKFDFNRNDPWGSLIEESDNYSKSSFKYILDHTLQRPRDFILFFKPLPELKFRIPLSFADVNILLGKFAILFTGEIKNELAAHYSSKEIIIIFKSLKNLISNTNEQSYRLNDIKDQLNKNGFNSDVSTLMELLFDLSLIGNKIEGKVIFKHWEKDDEFFLFNPKRKIVPHFTFRNYFKIRHNK